MKWKQLDEIQYLYSLSFAMRKVLQYCFILLLFSCQREYSFENGQHAKGSLQSDLTNNCLPKTITGNYIQDISLTDSNFIMVTVNVKQAGLYNISTDTVNGYYFTASGSFAATGMVQVNLNGKGKPLAIGTDNFKVSFDTSTCSFQISTIAQNPTAAYTLHGSPNTCMNFRMHGVLAKNVPATDSNYVAIELDVRSPGIYSLKTNTVNGYYFSGTGKLTSTGIQSINLKAIGTPVQSGYDIFTVTATTTICNFTDTVLTAVAVSNPDHFPLTGNSYWNYDDLLNHGDTLNRKIVDSAILNGRFYKTVNETPLNGSVTQFSYNKVDTNYYEYCSADEYTTSLKFAPEIKANILFLKENLSTDSSWVSDEYIGPATINQQAVFLQYKFTCKDANATVTVNGKTFAHVYIIELKPQVRSAITYPYAPTGEIKITYYAKGVGIIYSKTIVNSYLFQERQIRNWQVN